MSAIPGRALHYVFKIGDRAKNAFFFRQILGMSVSEGVQRRGNGGYLPKSADFLIASYNVWLSFYLNILSTSRVC